MSLYAIRHPGEQDRPKKLVYVWEFPVRLFHWVTAASIAVLFLTGLYIAFPILGTPGEAFDHFLMGRIRQIHFIAAYLWLVVFGLRALWLIMGNTYARSGVPLPWKRSWWGELWLEITSYFLVRRARSTRMGHNALAGLSYTIFPVGLGLLQILTGFALYSETNPTGLWARLTGWIIPLMGGSWRVHMWHHLFAWGFLWFVMIHIYIVIYDSFRDRDNLIEAMVNGYKSHELGKPDDH